MKRYLLMIALAGASFMANAELKTVVLSVPGMSCAACPITVKKALSQVEGVTQVSASLDKKEAVVSYDDSKVSAETLMKSTSNAGYPSHIKK